MKLDRSTKKDLKKCYPPSVVRKAAKKANNIENLNELLDLYMKSYNKTILLDYHPDNNFNNGGFTRSCFM
jgi:hypothetical protein